MLVELRRGKNVQNRRLATWLTEEKYESVESDWESQQQIREELKDKPSELKRYEDKLKEAIMMRNRSDAYHRKGKKSAAYKLERKCESLCETVTRTISIPKAKIITQPLQQPRKSAANDLARTAIKPIAPQKPLPNQQSR